MRRNCFLLLRYTNSLFSLCASLRGTPAFLKDEMTSACVGEQAARHAAEMASGECGLAMFPAMYAAGQSGNRSHVVSAVSSSGSSGVLEALAFLSERAEPEIPQP